VILGDGTVGEDDDGLNIVRLRRGDTFVGLVSVTVDSIGD
jgi:hypothetical protein